MSCETLDSLPFGLPNEVLHGAPCRSSNSHQGIESLESSLVSQYIDRLLCRLDNDDSLDLMLAIS